MIESDLGDIDEELVDFDEEVEDDEMGKMCVAPPQLALSDFFEDITFDKTSPVRHARRHSGWSCEDLGGEGLSMDHVFECDVDSSDKLTSPPPVDKTQMSLASIQWDDLQSMHPNKIFAIAVQYITSRAPQLTHVRRNKPNVKVQPWWYYLGKLSKNPMLNLVFPMCARRRSDAFYTMVAWISRLCGRSVRIVKQEMVEEWVTKGRWKRTDDKVKCRFHFLKEIEKESIFQNAFPELFDRRVNGRSSSTSFAVVSTRAEEALPVTQCYGYMATYNTSLGLQDSEVMQWVQQGSRDQELADKLKNHELHKSAFRRFVAFHKDLADKHRFKTWAVALEHSANAQHPARVHLHVYAGVDIRGGHILMGMPLVRPVSKASLEWAGCGTPIVRFTIIKRPSPSTILNGVSTGMYYVAGAKKTNIMLEASMMPFQAGVGCNLCAALHVYLCRTCLMTHVYVPEGLGLH
jgi:hypothetical protein